MKRPVFWIVFGVLTIGCIVFSVTFFPKAFPLVSLDITMDREAALERAHDLAMENNWGPEDFRQAASFVLDDEVQNYVELEAGGTGAFSEMLGGDLYAPYTWYVRHFKPGEINETMIRFTPAGSFYGFAERLSEEEPGAVLTAEAARIIADSTAAQVWDIDLGGYTLIEASQSLNPGGRLDHTLVYERPDVQTGDAKYRLRLVVSGDRLTELTHLVQIPEAFSRRYEEMRSSNETLALGAMIAMLIVCILGGAVIGLFYLLKQRWVQWRKPLLWGIIIAFMQLLAQFNSFPLLWMDYDTAVSTQGFLITEFVQFIVTFLLSAAFFTLVIMAAESLTRKAFPNHIRFWSVWRSDTAGSTAVLGRTIGGYFFVAFDFAFVVGWYFLVTNLFGWWNPSDLLFHPDVLATYLPWLSSVSISLQAGFLEECLFRAIPIASAALIGQRFGNRRLWIGIALVLQALMFGGGHANYPAQPAYARLVELIIPALAYGFIYLIFGLLPVIIFHFTFDCILIALPLFVAAAPGIWVDRAIVIVLCLVPLLIILRARIRAKKWTELTEEHYNYSWKPAEAAAEKVPEVSREGEETNILHGNRWRLFIVAGILGLIALLFTRDFDTGAPPLLNDRDEATEIARETLAAHNVLLTDDWKELTYLYAVNGDDHQFVWRTSGQDVYEQMLGRHISPPSWIVRYARFEGDVAQRAEEYSVLVSLGGETRKLRHILPEASPGATLERAEAQAIVDSVLIGEYGYDISLLKEVSVEPVKRPNRRDWEFTYADTTTFALASGEARVSVSLAGNEVVSHGRTVYVPEEWIRAERSRKLPGTIITILYMVILVALILMSAVIAIIRWSRKQFSSRAFFIFFATLYCMGLIFALNNWPQTQANFSTAQPFGNQLLQAILGPVILYLFLFGGVSLLIGLAYHWHRVNPGHWNARTVALGCAAGLVASGFTSLAGVFEPAAGPPWAGMFPSNAITPVYRHVIFVLGAYAAGTILLFFFINALNRLSNDWTRRKPLAIVLIIFTGYLPFIVHAENSIPYMLAAGLAFGIIMVILYCFLLRFEPALILFVSAVNFIITEIEAGVTQAYPDAVIMSVGGIALVVLASLSWYLLLTQLKISAPVK